MTAPENAAVARLQVQVEHLIEAHAEDKAERREMARKLDAIEAKLDQAAGGASVVRWVFGGGSLAAALGSLAALYAWLRS
jgi:hypothetical protein